MRAGRIWDTLRMLQALRGIGTDSRALLLRDGRATSVDAPTCMRTFSSPSVEFSKARNAYRKTLSEKRKAWFQEGEEHREVAAREQARVEQERRARQQQHLEKVDSDRRRDREEIVAKVQRQREKQRATKEMMREENLQREAGRQAILANLQDEKKRQMIEDSKHWIGDELELKLAIDRAVDAAEPLFVSSKVVNRGPRQSGDPQRTSQQ